jgi:hypothetical protein
LLSGVIVTLQSTGLAGERLFTALMALTVLAGLFQAMVAVLGGGRLIKFMPYPVIVGFTTGAALLMIQSQLKPIFGALVEHAWEAWRWIPFGTAVATYLCIMAASKWLPQAPPMLAGLLGGGLIFQLFVSVVAGPLPATWVVGALPDLTAITGGLAIAGLTELPAMPVLSGALALAMLASLNTLLASVIADMTTESRHNARRELLAQGMGQTLAGFLGSIGGSATTGATVVALPRLRCARMTTVFRPACRSRTSRNRPLRSTTIGRPFAVITVSGSVTPTSSTVRAAVVSWSAGDSIVNDGGALRLRISKPKYTRIPSASKATAAHRSRCGVSTTPDGTADGGVAAGDGHSLAATAYSWSKRCSAPFSRTSKARAYVRTKLRA